MAIHALPSGGRLGDGRRALCCCTPQQDELVPLSHYHMISWGPASWHEVQQMVRLSWRMCLRLAHPYVRTCVCAYVRMCVCAYVRMCVRAYVRMCVRAYVRMCVCAYALGRRRRGVRLGTSHHVSSNHDTNHDKPPALSHTTTTDPLFHSEYQCIDTSRLTTSPASSNGAPAKRRLTFGPMAHVGHHHGPRHLQLV